MDQAFELDVQRNPYDTVPLLSLSTGNGRIIVDDDGAAGHSLQCRSSRHPGQPDDRGRMSTILSWSTGNDIRVPLMHGYLQVVQGVTYPPP